MLIDWFTVLAQIVNFLILVILLKYFLYDRILSAMDQRERKIASRMEEAENKKQEAEQEAQSHRNRREEIEKNRNELLDRAREEAEKEKKNMINQAREEAEKERGKWLYSIKEEKDAFLRELRQMTLRRIYDLSGKAVKDLAGQDIEERIVDVFIRKMEDMPADKREQIIKAMGKEGHRINIRSAFELPATARRKITEKIHNLLNKDLEVDYRTEPEMIMGLEMKSNGRKLSWNMEDYLSELQEQVDEMLERETGKGEARSSNQAGG